ncbi:MAG: hypothetical protein LWX55_02680, partial [Deltaproteobacteria bacterium]|nr:hypothetical protein [Deltaproteobacteria bacterium]
GWAFSYNIPIHLAPVRKKLIADAVTGFPKTAGNILRRQFQLLAVTVTARANLAGKIRDALLEAVYYGPGFHTTSTIR